MRGSNSRSVGPAPVMALALAAAALCGPSPAARAAGLLVPSGSENAPLDIETQRVNVEIDNGIARTAVEQVFRNNRPQPLEAIYSFPVPNDATISHFSMSAASSPCRRTGRSASGSSTSSRSSSTWAWRPTHGRSRPGRRAAP